MKGYIIVWAQLNVNGMALFPFIFIREKADKNNNVLINHERIHLWQQLELLILPFYLIYLINYVYNRFKFNGHEQAYRQIIFEKEAYAMDHDLNYLKNRKLWNWLNY